ncbi:MAG: hypothetical protein PWQ55_1352 [Chloroflexota bacterium]|nr:hypothetical protein [Chloroflexota bacterium]
MILKGLLVVISGFVFIFSSGIPMSMISRNRPDYKREALYWGMGIWAVTFFVSTFLQSFIKQIITGGQAAGGSSVFSYLSGDIITILLLQLGMLWFLKNRLTKGKDVESEGLALGFGIGVIAHVFTGISEIGLGFRMIFNNGSALALGDAQAETIAAVANASVPNLLVTSLATILFRVALLTVSAAQGYLVAGAVKQKKLRFWAGAGLYLFLTWGALLLELALGEQNFGQILGVTSTLTSAVMIVFYALVTYLTFRWLSNELQSSQPKNKNKRSK